MICSECKTKQLLSSTGLKQCKVCGIKFYTNNNFLHICSKCSYSKKICRRCGNEIKE